MGLQQHRKKQSTTVDQFHTTRRSCRVNPKAEPTAPGRVGAMHVSFCSIVGNRQAGIVENTHAHVARAKNCGELQAGRQAGGGHGARIKAQRPVTGQRHARLSQFTGEVGGSQSPGLMVAGYGHDLCVCVCMSACMHGRKGGREGETDRHTDTRQHTKRRGCIARPGQKYHVPTKCPRGRYQRRRKTPEAG